VTARRTDLRLDQEIEPHAGMFAIQKNIEPLISLIASVLGET
jgi:hypothetical protein